MKNKDIKLIATDMDGTFLNDQHQYDQDLLRKVLASCKEKDIYFAAASGRALLSLKSLFKGFEDQMIFIAEMAAWLNFMEKTSTKRPCPKTFIWVFLRLWNPHLMQTRISFFWLGKKGAMS